MNSGARRGWGSRNNADTPEAEVACRARAIAVISEVSEFADMPELLVA